MFCESSQGEQGSGWRGRLLQKARPYSYGRFGATEPSENVAELRREQDLFFRLEAVG